jgi:AraC-like DNA-binding protein
MTVRYDTASEPAGRRLAVWQDIVCDVFVQLDCKSDLEDFHGSVTQSRLGELAYDRPLHRLASDFITGLSQVIEAVEVSAADRLCCQALDLVAIAIGQSAETNRPSTYSSAMLVRLKAYISGRLHDPGLCLADTAAALGISTRYVNVLLQGQNDSFGRHVLARRLEACRRDLADLAHAHRQLIEIAFAWGFNDQSHFSRTFKERFGVSPRDYRMSVTLQRKASQ